MEKILVDTCIFIDIFRGDDSLLKCLKSIDTVINPIIYMELLQGSKDKTELSKIDKFLKYFELKPIDEATSLKSIELIKFFSKSHNLLIPDAIIAATSIISGYYLFTFNKKDFDFIPNINFFIPA